MLGNQRSPQNEMPREGNVHKIWNVYKISEFIIYFMYICDYSFGPWQSWWISQFANKTKPNRTWVKEKNIPTSRTKLCLKNYSWSIFYRLKMNLHFSFKTLKVHTYFSKWFLTCLKCKIYLKKIQMWYQIVFKLF